MASQLRQSIKLQESDTLQLNNTLHRSSSGARQRSNTHESCDKTTDSIKQVALGQFVRQSIRQRRCKIYIPKKKHQENQKSDCHCGRDDTWHRVRGISTDVQPDKKTDWHADHHTLDEDPNTFGTISFCGFGREASQNAPYIRLDHKTRPSIAWEILSSFWNVPPPKLIISVTGGAKKFFMKNRLKATTKRGLVKAASSTGAWIITGGTKTGVMEFVGEAVKEHALTTGGIGPKLVTLGVAPWGVVNNRKSLINDDKGGLFPAEYKREELCNDRKHDTAPLDPNHTHFVLVDNGTENTYGTEIEFRAALEEHISQTKVIEKGVHVPVVTLVIEGGINTLVTALEGMRKKTPVVVIQGSGRAADLLAWAYRETRNKSGGEDESIISETFEAELRNQAHSLLGLSFIKNQKDREAKTTECVQNVLELLDTRSLMTVFTLDEGDTTKEIDYAILHALLKANKSDRPTQLNLALAWNRCDVAQNYIFTPENEMEWQADQLYEALMFALVRDYTDFVQMFMDNGVDLKKFLTRGRLCGLYKEVIDREDAGSSAYFLKKYIEEFDYNENMCICCCPTRERNKKNSLLCKVGRVLQDLTRDLLVNPYEGESVQGHEEYASVFDHPARELFWWAVLLNRQSLASFFWQLGQDQIGGALVGSALLKSLAYKAAAVQETDLSMSYIEHSNEFQKLAVGVLNTCYERNQRLTHDLLMREIPTCENTTLLMLADGGEHMDFMGHSACQTKLNQLWNGHIALSNATWKIMCSLLIPLFLVSIKFANVKPKDKIANKTVKPETDRSTSNQVLPSEDEAVTYAVKKPRAGTLSHTREEKDRLYEIKLSERCKQRDDDTERLSVLQAMRLYYTAPVVKFCYYTISQIIFLGLFSYFVMADLHHSKVGIVEIIVWGWALTLFVEEARQIIVREQHRFTSKLVDYFHSLWNRFDMLVLALLLLSVILRVTLTGSDFVWARMSYCVTLALFYIRFMQVFFAWRNIGPKVVMIKMMISDLMFFLCILAVFILSYGVASHALRYPNSPSNWYLLKDAIYMPYWQMYGELMLEDLEGDVGECYTDEAELLVDPDLDRCPEESWLAILLFAVYMILTNVLLLNLLIAMFSYTFDKVQENSEKVWRYYRFGLVHECFERPTLAPPLIIINHAWRLIKYFSCCSLKEKFSRDFKKKYSKTRQNMLTTFERSNMENYMFERDQLSRENIDVKVTSAGSRIEKVIEDMEHLREQIEVRYAQPSTSGTPVPQTPVTSPIIPPTQPTATSSAELEAMQKTLVLLQQQQEQHQAQMQRMLKLLTRMSTAKADDRPAKSTRQSTGPPTVKTAFRPQPTDDEPEVVIEEFGKS